MGIFTNYPKEGGENPFDGNAKGKYFAYLSNRDCCLSYLSDKLEDFNYNNKNLYEAMSMGYTTLSVFERGFLISSEGMWEKFNNEKCNKLLFNIYKDGEFKIVTQEEMLETYNCDLKIPNDRENEFLNMCNILKEAKEKNKCNEILGIGVIKLKEYNWH